MGIFKHVFSWFQLKVGDIGKWCMDGFFKFGHTPLARIQKPTPGGPTIFLATRRIWILWSLHVYVLVPFKVAGFPKSTELL